MERKEWQCVCRARECDLYEHSVIYMCPALKESVNGERSQTAAAVGDRTLPCVLWSGTLQLSWSVPLPLLCGPLTWTHSALYC